MVTWLVGWLGLDNGTAVLAGIGSNSRRLRIRQRRGCVIGIGLLECEVYMACWVWNEALLKG